MSARRQPESGTPGSGIASAWRVWWRPALLAVVLLPVASWVFHESQRVFRAEWASLAERQLLLQWVSGAAAPQSAQEWQRVQQALQSSLALTPDDPDLHERMGDVYVVAGQRDWADVALRHRHFAAAAASYERAIALRPSEPQTWAMLASARQAMGDARGHVQEAWARARALGPYEGHVQPILMQVVLTDWPGASPEMQAWAKSLFDAGNEATRRDINVMAAHYGLKFSPDAASAP